MNKVMNITVLALAACLPDLGQAQEEPPSLEFLEYLGRFEEEGNAWFMEAEIDGQVPQAGLEAERIEAAEPGQEQGDG